MRFEVFNLGLIDYKTAWDFQKETFLNVKNAKLDAGLILCRHYPVITLGRLTKRDNILIPEGELKNKGLSVYSIERGGDVTYHGPGQVTVYPVFNLQHFKKDIHWFLRKLEDAAINLLAGMGIQSQRSDGFSGVWVQNKKIASVGIAIKNWINIHGLSINVSRHDLHNFNFIRPCGMDIQMTCVEKILDRPVDISRIEKSVIDSIIGTFSIEEAAR